MVCCLQVQLTRSELRRENTSEGQSNTDSIFLCTICREANADALNLPCGHLFLCTACAKGFQEHEGTVCNSCRQPSRLRSLEEVPERFCKLPLKSERPLELLVGLWNSWKLRQQNWRLVQQRRCRGHLCKQSVSTVNMPCGHRAHCAACAVAWRAAKNDTCPKCKEASSLKILVTEQDCGICFTAASADNIIAISGCGHQLCVNCAIGCIRYALGAAHVEIKPHGVRCPLCVANGDSNCSFLTAATVRKQFLGRHRPCEPNGEAISEEEVARFERFVLEANIPSHRRFYCCNANCARMLDLADFSDTWPQLKCWYCCSVSCGVCQITWHGALTCEEVRQMRRSSDAGGVGLEKLNNRIIDAITKACPNCGFRISHYHGHGCHHIAPGTGCLNCGQHFCYSCLSKGSSCRPSCSAFCSADNLAYFLVDGPLPRDRRCGCTLCPECRPGRQPCAQCDGSCVVCMGTVPPGTLRANYFEEFAIEKRRAGTGNCLIA